MNFLIKKSTNQNTFIMVVGFIVVFISIPYITHAVPAGTSTWDDWDGDGATWTSGRDHTYTSGTGGCCDNTLGGGSNSGTVTMTPAQLQAILAANTITNAEALAMTPAQFDLLAINSVARVSAEIARARATGRDVVISNGSIFIETCINGRGGSWIFPAPPAYSQSSYGYSQSSYGYSQSSYGYSQSSYTTCTPTVDCTCAERGDCVITAQLEALVQNFAVPVAVGTEPVYSSMSRDIFPNVPIWLRWRGYDQDGNAAELCEGTDPEDFIVAPAHVPLGSFENNDGGAGGFAGVPYPGLANLAQQTYAIKCTRPGAVTGIDTLSLKAISCTLNCTEPPDIFVNDSPNPATVRYGSSVKVEWFPYTNTGCTLSTNLSSDSNNDANVQDSTQHVVTGETTFTITCDENRTDSVTIKVLPKTGET